MNKLSGGVLGSIGGIGETSGLVSMAGSTGVGRIGVGSVGGWESMGKSIVRSSESSPISELVPELALW